MGVGKFSITSSIIGDSKINAGIGSLELNILEKEENYKIKIDKGIGNIKINGENVTDDIYGSGERIIDIEGGIGNINIDFD